MKINMNTNSRTIQKSNQYKYDFKVPSKLLLGTTQLAINWKDEDNYFKTDADRNLCANSKLSSYKSSYIDSISF